MTYYPNGTTLLDIYREHNCVRHFNAITTHSEHSVGKALEAVTEDMGNIGGLLAEYRGRGTEDLAKDLGVSYEMAVTISRVTGLI